MQRLKQALIPLDFPLGLFLISAVLGLIPAYDLRLAWLTLAVFLAGGLLYLGVSRGAVRQEIAFRIATTAALAGCLIALYFITQYGYYPEPEKIEIVSRLGSRLSSLFPNIAFWRPVGNSVATLLEGLVFLSIGAALARQGRLWKVALFAAAGVMALAVAISASRGAWLAVAGAGLLWLALYYRPARWMAVLASLALLGLVAVVVIRHDIMILDRIPIVNRYLAPLFIRPDRLDVYRGSIYLVQDTPLTGIGLGQQFAMVYSRYVLLIQVPFLFYSHNFYLEAWLEQGLLGITALVGLVAALYLTAWTQRKAPRDPLQESTCIGLTAVLLHGVTDARQYIDLWTWLPFFLLLGLNAAGLLRRRKAGEAPASLGLVSAAVMGAFLLLVTVTMPSLPAAWHANLGSLQQAKAELNVRLPQTEGDKLLATAEQNFRSSMALAPGERPAHFRLGLLLMNRGDFPGALQELALAHAADLANPAVLKAYGLACVWNGRLEEARELLQSSADIVQELNTWGYYRSTQKQPALARNAYRVSLLLKPDQPEVRQALEGLGQ